MAGPALVARSPNAARQRIFPASSETLSTRCAPTEGQEADDPYAIAAGCWAMVQALRDSDRWDEAVALAAEAARNLEAHTTEDAPPDWHGTLGVELRRAGEALRAAESVDPDLIVSVPRRARHFIEVARAHHQRGERHAVWALLDRSHRTAPGTIRYNGYARDMLLDLVATPPAGMRADVLAA